MPRMPIQDEPESTIGRKPSELHEGEPERAGSTRPGTSTRREEGGETRKAGAELRERELGEPPVVRGLDE